MQVKRFCTISPTAIYGNIAGFQWTKCLTTQGHMHVSHPERFKNAILWGCNGATKIKKLSQVQLDREQLSYCTRKVIHRMCVLQSASNAVMLRKSKNTTVPMSLILDSIIIIGQHCRWLVLRIRFRGSVLALILRRRRFSRCIIYIHPVL